MPRIESPSQTTFNLAKLPSRVSTSACGKAILVGEHAVVYGSQAVALPLKQMRLHITIEPRIQEVDESFLSITMGDKQVSQRVFEVFQEACELLGITGVSAKITGRSTLPIGAGVGSSASLCVLALRAISEAYTATQDPQRLANLGNILERRFHGNPSGLDTAVVAFEQPVMFAKGKPILPIQMKPDLEGAFQFALVDSGVRASTIAMIKIARSFFMASDGDQKLARFNQDADLVKQGLERGDAGAITEAMESCASLLQQTGIVTPTLTDIIGDCKKLGCPAAKTTGAGGGGVILAQLPPEDPLRYFKNLKAHFGAERVFHIQI